MADEEGLEGFMATNDEETLWVLEENDAFIALGDMSDPRREAEKENQEAKGESPTRWFQTVAPAGRPIWQMKMRIPTPGVLGKW